MDWPSVKSSVTVPPRRCPRRLCTELYFACPLALSSICVPLSRCTFFVEETMIDPCVALEAAELIESPCRPKTPLLFEARRPSEVNPPTAPVDGVAAFKVPPAFTGTELAVFTTLPVVAPAVEATPPNNPPPPFGTLCHPPDCMSQRKPILISRITPRFSGTPVCQDLCSSDYFLDKSNR
jgi:hypothetical protein